MNTLTVIDRTELQRTIVSAEIFNNWIGFIEGTPKTVSTYTRAIKQFYTWAQDNGISRPSKADIRAYRDYLTEQHKPATVQLYLTAVKRFYAWAEEEGLTENIAKNVKSGVKISTEHKKDYLTSAQIKRLLASIDRSTLTGKRDFAIISLMITTGMRTIEISRANVEDLGIRGDFTALYYQGKGRSEKAEFKKVAEPVEEAIKDYLRARGKVNPSDALFASTANRNEGQRLTTRSISRLIKDRLIGAGLESDRLTAHSLRHTCGTQNLINGGSLEETQLLLGHKNINTTMIYNHAISRDNSNAEARIAEAIFS